MRALKEKYVTNKKGERIGVVLDLKAYTRMLEALEELESIRAYDAAKASGEKPISLKHALKDIESKRS